MTIKDWLVPGALILGGGAILWVAVKNRGQTSTPTAVVVRQPSQNQPQTSGMEAFRAIAESISASQEASMGVMREGLALASQGQQRATEQIASVLAAQSQTIQTSQAQQMQMMESFLSNITSTFQSSQQAITSAMSRALTSVGQQTSSVVDRVLSSQQSNLESLLNAITNRERETPQPGSIESWYTTYLGREADPAGLAYWQQRAATEGSANLLDDFLLAAQANEEQLTAMGSTVLHSFSSNSGASA